jgi:hypothetical protein
MRKRYYFAAMSGSGWPDPETIAPFFLLPPGKRWFFETGTDSGGFALEGVEGTENLRLGAGRVDLSLGMYGHPELGVFLLYQKTGSKDHAAFSSKGDLAKLREYVRTLHDDPMPVGLYIPYVDAWRAVKEFLETDGALPTSIEWIANRDLPANTFPDPGRAR